MIDEEEFAARSQLKWTRAGDAWILLSRRPRGMWSGQGLPGHVAIIQSQRHCIEESTLRQEVEAATSRPSRSTISCSSFRNRCESDVVHSPCRTEAREEQIGSRRIQ